METTPWNKFFFTAFLSLFLIIYGEIVWNFHNLSELTKGKIKQTKNVG